METSFHNIYFRNNNINWCRIFYDNSGSSVGCYSYIFIYQLIQELHVVCKTTTGSTNWVSIASNSDGSNLAATPFLCDIYTYANNTAIVTGYNVLL